MKIQRWVDISQEQVLNCLARIATPLMSPLKSIPVSMMTSNLKYYHKNIPLGSPRYERFRSTISKPFYKGSWAVTPL